MTNSVALEYVGVAVATGEATLRCADGRVLHVPREALFRSSLLRQAVTDTMIGNEMFVRLPKGVIEAWVDALKTIDVDIGMPGQGMCQAPRRAQSAEDLMKYLQAADFFVDEGTFKELCTRICEQLFHPFISSSEQQVDKELETELVTLHNTLQLEVLATSRVPIVLQLWLLSPGLRQNALHAAFPSITATSSLTVHCALHSCDVAEIFWQVLGQETDLKSLTLTGLVDTGDETLSDAFLQCMSQLTCLEYLSLDGLCIGSSAAQLIRCLGSKNTLTALNLSRNDLGEGDDNPESTRNPWENITHLSEALMQLTALRSLEMASNNIAEFEAAALSKCIAQLPQLESLDISDNVLNKQGIIEIAKGIPMCHKLRIFSCGGFVAGTVTDNSGSVELFQSLGGLSRLDLPHLGEDTLSQIDVAPQFSKLADLEVLKLGRVSVADLQALSGSISILTSLHTLHLTYPCSPEGAAALEGVVSVLPLLQDVAFRSLVNGADFIRSVAPSALADCFRTASDLRHIDLSLTPLHLAAAQALFASLKRFTALETLNLTAIKISDCGAEALAELLMNMPCLRHLCLSHVRLSDISFKKLARPIASLPQLETLSFFISEANTEASSTIAQQFSSMSSLKELDLSCSTLSIKDAAALSKNLPLLTSLQCLNLASTDLGNKGVMKVASGLGKLHSLQVLDLGSVQMNCDAIRVVCFHISNLRYLEEILISRNEIRADGMQSLARCARTLPSLNLIELYENSICYNRDLSHDPFLQVIAYGMPFQNISPLDGLDLEPDWIL